MSLRLRLGLSFALVAVTTALVMVAATPAVIRYGFEPVRPAPTDPPSGSGGPPDGSPAPGTEASPSSSPAPGSGSGSPDGDPAPTPTRGDPSPAGSSAAPGPSGADTGTAAPPTATPRPTPRPSPGPAASPLQSGRPTATSSPSATGGPPETGGPSGSGGPPSTPRATKSPGGAGPGGTSPPGDARSADTAAAYAVARVPMQTAWPGEGGGDPAASPSGVPGELAWVEVERRTSNLLLLVAALSAVVAIAIGLILAEALIRPLRDLGKAASAIAGGDLARRSGVSGRHDEIGDLGRSFDTMAAALQQSDESRRRFLQDAAHELGTPVTAIHTTASAILDGVYQPERRHLETIRDEARLLARIVDDLRTIALAEVRQLPMVIGEVDLAALATSTADAFAAAAAAEGRQIVVTGAGPAVAAGDADRLRQVLAALADNALRHVPAGGRVWIRTAVAGSRVVVDVEDDGPGLGDPADRVFERFFRADAPPDRAAGHAGLGLAIVRALVEAQDGRVSARNRAEGGASFRVELPAAGAPTGTGPGPATSQPGA